MLFTAFLKVSKCLIILQCILICLSITVSINVTTEECIVLDFTKPPGESYGSRIQKLEDSMVYKLNRPNKTHWKPLVEEINACLNITKPFFLWLKLDDKEEIKYAQQFLKNGVPQIVTRNYTELTMLRTFKFAVYQMLLLKNAIMDLKEAWAIFRDRYFQECYNNEEYYKKMMEKYEVEGYPQLKITTDDMSWPQNIDDYREGDSIRERLIAEKKGGRKGKDT